jgi:uncharacterized protein (TIGR02421 family)
VIRIPSTAADVVNDRFIDGVCRRLAANQRIRRSLPVWGRLHIDRQLPFLCIYRRPHQLDDAGTDRLVTTEAAYLLAASAPRLHAGLSELVRRISTTVVAEFGAMLLLEVWATDDHGIGPEAPEGIVAPPAFHILAPRGGASDGFVDRFEDALAKIRLRRQRAAVTTSRGARWSPPRLMPIIPTASAGSLGCTVLGLEVRPVYRDALTGEVYPLVLRQLRRALSRTLRRTFFHFSRVKTTHRPRHYQVLGRRAVVKAVWDIDRRLGEVAERFDFLLQVTPVNGAEAWRRFKGRRFAVTPSFVYRPMTTDPAVLKRRLFDTPVERVEDPALAFLFREKQEELDRQITMLQDLNSRRFVYGSLQLYGEVDDELTGVATDLLARIPPRARDDSAAGVIDAARFVELARVEIDAYRSQWPELDVEVQVREDIASGLMVSRGRLLVSKDVRIPAARAEALLHHEIGTHVVTYHNGRSQPFRQLSAGLAGYEALQEGLAVFAEYLVGGLSRPRLRMLAARVIAARCLVDGATFMETYRTLVQEHGFQQQTAFTIAMRVHRGGGLTKDAVYLRGLMQVLDYLGDGGELDPLYVGKLAIDHVPIITELRWRNVLREPPLRPRYLDHPQAEDRLTYVRTGVRVPDLIRRS